jgi:hypothetical protein
MIDRQLPDTSMHTMCSAGSVIPTLPELSANELEQIRLAGPSKILAAEERSEVVLNEPLRAQAVGPFHRRGVGLAATCQGGVDNDGDGYVDDVDYDCWPVLGLEAEDSQPACTDGLDNDGDGYIDQVDFDCGPVLGL